MSDTESVMPSPEAVTRVDNILAEMGIDIAEGANSVTIAAFTEMLIRIEDHKIVREQRGEA